MIRRSPEGAARRFRETAEAHRTNQLHPIGSKGGFAHITNTTEILEPTVPLEPAERQKRATIHSFRRKHGRLPCNQSKVRPPSSLSVIEIPRILLISSYHPFYLDSRRSSDQKASDLSPRVSIAVRPSSNLWILLNCRRSRVEESPSSDYSKLVIGSCEDGPRPRQHQRSAL